MKQIIFINVPQSMSGRQTRLTDLFPRTQSFHVPQLAVCNAAHLHTSVVYPQTMTTTL
jgi:hypothetical protein